MKLVDANGHPIKEYDDVRTLDAGVFWDTDNEPHVIDPGHEGTIIIIHQDMNGRRYVKLESCSSLMFHDAVPSRIEFVRSAESKLP